MGKRAKLMANATNTVAVQNILAPFCRVLEKGALPTFLCLSVLVSSSKFQSYLSTKKQIEYFNLTRSWYFRKLLTAAPSITPPISPASQDK